MTALFLIDLALILVVIAMGRALVRVTEAKAEDDRKRDAAVNGLLDLIDDIEAALPGVTYVQTRHVVAHLAEIRAKAVTL